MWLERPGAKEPDNRSLKSRGSLRGGTKRWACAREDPSKEEQAHYYIALRSGGLLANAPPRRALSPRLAAVQRGLGVTGRLAGVNRKARDAVTAKRGQAGLVVSTALRLHHLPNASGRGRTRV